MCECVVVLDRIPDLSPEQDCETVERVQVALVHVFSCSVEKCTFTLCQKMKGIAIHFRSCNLRNASKCSLCEQFTICCFFHALTCTESMCLVPACHGLGEMLRLKKSGEWRANSPYSAQENPPAQTLQQLEPIEIEMSDATIKIEDNIPPEGSRSQLPENFVTPQQIATSAILVQYANILTWLNDSNFTEKLSPSTPFHASDMEFQGIGLF